MFVFIFLVIVVIHCGSYHSWWNLLSSFSFPCFPLHFSSRFHKVLFLHTCGMSRSFYRFSTLYPLQMPPHHGIHLCFCNCHTFLNYIWSLELMCVLLPASLGIWLRPVDNYFQSHQWFPIFYLVCSTKHQSRVPGSFSCPFFRFLLQLYHFHQVIPQPTCSLSCHFQDNPLRK